MSESIRPKMRGTNLCIVWKQNHWKYSFKIDPGVGVWFHIHILFHSTFDLNSNLSWHLTIYRKTWIVVSRAVRCLLPVDRHQSPIAFVAYHGGSEPFWWGAYQQWEKFPCYRCNTGKYSNFCLVFSHLVSSDKIKAMFLQALLHSEETVEFLLSDDKHRKTCKSLLQCFMCSLYRVYQDMSNGMGNPVSLVSKWESK